MTLYLRFVVRSALRRGWSLQLITTLAATKHPAYTIIDKEYGEAFETVLIPRVPFPESRPTAWNLLKYQFSQYAAFSAAYRCLTAREQPDLIYFNNLDYFDKALALLGSPFGHTPFAGMLMAIGFHHRKMGIRVGGTRNDWVYQKLFQRLLRIQKLWSVITVDEPFLDYMRLQDRKYQAKVHYVPEAASLRVSDVTREQVRQDMEIRTDQVVVLVYGGLSQRKGIGELLAAMAHPSCPENIVVILAGQQASAVQELLGQPRIATMRAAGRILEIRGFLDEYQESRAFCAADVVWVGYKDFYGTSGVLVTAASFGLPVIVCREGVLGWTANRYRLGEIVDIADAQQVSHALARLALNPALRSIYGRNGLTMATRHSGERFGDAVCEIISNGQLWEQAEKESKWKSHT